MRTELFKRYDGNPIIRPDDIPYPGVARVFNSAATELEKKVLLLMRVKTQRGDSHLTLAESENGVTDWQIRNSPTIQAEALYGEDSYFGLEDPRVVFVKGLGFVIACVSGSAGFIGNPYGITLIKTTNFREFSRISKPLTFTEKNACLFPQKINGEWVLMHRPYSKDKACIAVSSSPDMIHWGKARQILYPIPGTWCDRHVGLAAQPIKTEKGWLIIFHGSEDVASRTVYYIGLALLNLQTLKVTHRTKQWVFGPKDDYEGGPNGIVFSCGAIAKEGKLIMYYGADDYSIALATANFNELFENLIKCPVS